MDFLNAKKKGIPTMNKERKYLCCGCICIILAFIGAIIMSIYYRSIEILLGMSAFTLLILSICAIVFGADEFDNDDDGY